MGPSYDPEHLHLLNLRYHRLFLLCWTKFIHRKMLKSCKQRLQELIGKTNSSLNVSIHQSQGSLHHLKCAYYARQLDASVIIIFLVSAPIYQRQIASIWQGQDILLTYLMILIVLKMSLMMILLSLLIKSLIQLQELVNQLEHQVLLLFFVFR